MPLYSLKDLKSKLSSTTSAIPKILGIIKPTGIFRGASLAHRRMTPEQRAELAARWLNGQLLVLPTITLACVVFKTNYASIIKARGRRGNRPHWNMWLGVLARAWSNCDEEQRAAFARAFEPGLWKALERVTDVQHD
jgi:hypothetical protein